MIDWKDIFEVEIIDRHTDKIIKSKKFDNEAEARNFARENQTHENGYCIMKLDYTCIAYEV